VGIRSPGLHRPAAASLAEDSVCRYGQEDGARHRNPENAPVPALVVSFFPFGLSTDQISSNVFVSRLPDRSRFSAFRSKDSSCCRGGHRDSSVQEKGSDLPGVGLAETGHTQEVPVAATALNLWNPQSLRGFHYLERDLGNTPASGFGAAHRPNIDTDPQLKVRLLG
jgi:hypothetical protein